MQVPVDRTEKQPVIAICRNPECREDGKQFEFFVTDDHFCCPKCGANREPMLALKVLIHLLVPHPQGPIQGQGGKKFVIACDDRRAYLATVTNKEAATGSPLLANCPTCIERAKQIGVIKKRIFVVPGREEEQPTEPETAPEAEEVKA